MSQTVSFAAGETSKTVSVPITDDSTVESSETVQLSLSSPSSGATLASPSSATLTIVDNDVAPAPSTTTTTTTTTDDHHDDDDHHYHADHAPGHSDLQGQDRLLQALEDELPRGSSGQGQADLQVLAQEQGSSSWVLSLKQGKKWAVVKSVKKTGSFKTSTR